MTDARFYVYTLTDPRDGTVFYVGKGSCQRLRAHFADFLAGRVVNDEKHAKIGDIYSAGHEPRAEIVYANLAENEAFMRERALIAHFGAHNLTNMITGTSTPAERAAATNARAVSWAKSRLAELKPFYDWLAERRPNAAEVDLYVCIGEELKAIAAGQRAFHIFGPGFEFSC